MAGDFVVVKPGGKIPVDGTIIEGTSAIDQSMLTGESMPVSKKTGDTVIGATINKSGNIRYKATKAGAATALAQIVKLAKHGLELSVRRRVSHPMKSTGSLKEFRALEMRPERVGVPWCRPAFTGFEIWYGARAQSCRTQLVRPPCPARALPARFPW
jgi:hypothetical protein